MRHATHGLPIANRSFPRPALRVLVTVCVLVLPYVFGLPPASAAATANDVFRSFNENVSERTDYSKLLPWVCGAAGLIILLVLLTNRQKRQAVPKPLNHSKKLLREVAKALALKSAEVKQLKLLADEHGCDSPLTLLLCPSLLSQAAAAKNSRTDRKVLAQLFARLGVGKK